MGEYFGEIPFWTQLLYMQYGSFVTNQIPDFWQRRLRVLLRIATCASTVSAGNAAGLAARRTNAGEWRVYVTHHLAGG